MTWLCSVCLWGEHVLPLPASPWVCLILPPWVQDSQDMDTVPRETCEHLNKYRESVFMDWMMQYHQGGNSLQSGYRFNAMFFKIPAGFFFSPRNWQATPQGKNSQKYSEKEQNWRAYISWLQNLLWSFSKKQTKNRVVLACGQTYISMEQTWESRNKPLRLWLIGFQQKCQGNSMEEKDSHFNKWCWDKVG